LPGTSQALRLSARALSLSLRASGSARESPSLSHPGPGRRARHRAHIGYARPVTGPRPGRPRHGHCFLIKLSLSLWRGRQCFLASRRQVWCLLPAAIRLLGITRGVSSRVRGQCSPQGAKQRLSAGRARDHPVMEIVPKALSLSLSLSLRVSLSLSSFCGTLKSVCRRTRCGLWSVFGLWRVCFPPILIRTDRRLLV
jgi:hypothetical protein